MEKIINILRNKERLLSFSLSLFLALSALFLTYKNSAILPSYTKPTPAINHLYFLIFAIFILIPIFIIFISENVGWRTIIRKLLWVYLPGEIIFICELTKYGDLNYWIYLFTGLYIAALAISMMASRKFQWEKEKKPKEAPLHDTGKQKKITVLVMLIIIGFNLFFSAYKVEQFAAVDEPLWLFGRIAAYWNNVQKMKWEKTYISDKPGVTVALLSGVGLIQYDPDNYEDASYQGKVYRNQQTDIEPFFFSFRLPIVLFAAFSLFLFYFFLEKLLSKEQALSSLILIALSPILIGMNRIINPDSLLWIFSSLSVISYLAYLKRRENYLLYWTGIFLGLGLLTKYVVNILFIFFFGLIFLEYIWRKEKYDTLGIQTYFKQSLTDFLILSTTAIITFALLCPAVWVRPEVLLLATVESQAFHPVFHLFIGIIGIVLLDTLVLKNFFLRHILNFLERRKRLIGTIIFTIFLLSVFSVLINTYTGMRWIDFESILTSPKSAHENSLGFFQLKVFLSNFYPLLFGISPLALIAVILGLVTSGLRKKNNTENLWIPLCLITFILIYYLGSIVTGVASTIRYQIILYPIIFILSGIFLSEMIKYLGIGKKISIGWAYLFLIIACLYPLFKTMPLYSGYASAMLPKNYYIDLKDMGAGSYEAAQYLNSLPDHKHINIWTDKTGVCYFFKGNCYTGFSVPKSINLGYLVLSSGRESRTSKMIRPIKNDTLDFAKYYSQEKNLSFQLDIDNRSGQYIKIIDLTKGETK